MGFRNKEFAAYIKEKRGKKTAKRVGAPKKEKSAEKGSTEANVEPSSSGRTKSSQAKKRKSVGDAEKPPVVEPAAVAGSNPTASAPEDVAGEGVAGDGGRCEDNQQGVCEGGNGGEDKPGRKDAAESQGLPGGEQTGEHVGAQESEQVSVGIYVDSAASSVCMEIDRSPGPDLHLASAREATSAAEDGSYVDGAIMSKAVLPSTTAKAGNANNNTNDGNNDSLTACVYTYDT